MKNNLWVLITLVTTLLGFLAGYIISSSTGVEPGFFEAVETGSYGGGGGAEAIEGVTTEDQEYYRKLTEE